MPSKQNTCIHTYVHNERQKANFLPRNVSKTNEEERNKIKSNRNYEYAK